MMIWSISVYDGTYKLVKSQPVQSAPTNNIMIGQVNHSHRSALKTVFMTVEQVIVQEKLQCSQAV